MPQCEKLTSLAIWGAGGGGGGVNNHTGSILVHIYPLIYINLHVKYGRNLIRTFGVKIKNMNKKNLFWGGHGGAFTYNPWAPGAPKCQQMQASSQWRQIYKGKQLKTSFSYMGQM